MSAPERVGVKKTTGYASNWWGVLTDAFDEDAVEYVRADRLTEALEALRFYGSICADPEESPWNVYSDDYGRRARATLAKLEDTK